MPHVQSWKKTNENPRKRGVFFSQTHPKEPKSNNKAPISSQESKTNTPEAWFCKQQMGRSIVLDSSHFATEPRGFCPATWKGQEEETTRRCLHTHGEVGAEAGTHEDEENCGRWWRKRRRNEEIAVACITKSAGFRRGQESILTKHRLTEPISLPLHFFLV